MNNEEVIDKAPTAREVFEKAGGEIRHEPAYSIKSEDFGLQAYHFDEGSTSHLAWPYADLILSAAYSQFRAAEDAKWEEALCVICGGCGHFPSGCDKPDDDIEPCDACKGHGTLRRRIEAKENGS